jgi:glutamyl-tRNA reductase
MRLQVKDAIEQELNRAIKKGFVPSEYRNNMQKMAEQMFNRFLHNATQNLRKYSSKSGSTKQIEAIQEIFEIETQDKNLKRYRREHHKGYK